MVTLDYSKTYRGADQDVKTNALAVNLGGSYTTTGGAAAEAATITGVLATDSVVATLADNGTNNVTLVTAEVTAANTVTFTFSLDPVADTVVNYLILR